jgi:hypothetical protein
MLRPVRIGLDAQHLRGLNRNGWLNAIGSRPAMTLPRSFVRHKVNSHTKSFSSKK